MRTRKLSNKLESYRLLIFNSKDAQIAPLLTNIGVDAPYLKQGEELYTQAMQLVTQQKQEYQEQSLAYDTFYTEMGEVEDTYRRTYKLVKILSRNNIDLQNRLGFQNGKAYAIEEWIDKGVDFYNRLQSENGFLTTIAKYMVTADRIQQESNSLSELKTLRNKATLEKGQAQEATRLRNQKLDELADYCLELKAIAQIALERQPQLLEKLGILVRS